MIITVTHDEYADLESLAHARGDRKASWNPQGTFMNLRAAKRNETPLESWQVHLLGLLGEFAVAKYLREVRGVDIDVDREINNGDKDEGDLAYPDGRRIQVKTRQRRGWDFALEGTDPHELKADEAWLVYPAPFIASEWRGIRDGNPKGMEVWGYLPREDFLRYAGVENYGHGERLRVKPASFIRL